MRVRYEPAGVHYFERSTGLHVLFDELRPPSGSWAKMPRFLSVALTNACELHCAYCFAPKHGARLAREQLLRWADEADANGCFGIGFGGGEPTLYPDFGSVCQEVSECTELSVSFTTHGHWHKRDLARELEGRVHFIRLSMDGMHGTYESNRGKPFGEFLAALETIRATAPFGINYLINDETIHELPSAADFVVERGAMELLLLPEVPQNGRNAPSERTIDALNGWMLDNWANYPLRSSSMYADRLTAPVAAISDGRRYMDFLHIDASGVLKGCAFDSDGVQISEQSSLQDAIHELQSRSDATHLAGEEL